MKMTDLRRNPQWVILGFVMMAATIGGALRIFAHPEQSLSGESSVNSGSHATRSIEPLKSSVGPISTSLEAAADPSALLIATPSAEDRLADLPGTGRPDPFMSVLQAVERPRPSQSTATPDLASAASESETTNSGTPQSIPATSVSDTVDLPPVPTTTWSPQPAPLPLPAIPVANAPVSIPSLPTYSAPVDPMQAIELSGVVQLGDRVAVIVRESNDTTSRHMFAGDFLAGGRIKIKSIDLSSQEPLIILEYQGKEYPRIVGS
ncbi:MAG: hypothetical protein ACFBSF_15910 [Leptolyngbyaceae cyanobacterium]